MIARFEFKKFFEYVAVQSSASDASWGNTTGPMGLGDTNADWEKSQGAGAKGKIRSKWSAQMKKKMKKK